MKTQIDFSKILFLDIETVPETEHFKSLSPAKQELWNIKSKYQRTEKQSAEEFYGKAGIWAEFGKIVCISVGVLIEKESRSFRLKSYYGVEKDILIEFKSLITTFFTSPLYKLCAHNGKEFDFPYILRRMIINQIEIPPQLDMSGKKPWEIPHLDTLELWKFGDYKHYTSLALLANILEIESPKDDIKGSDVAQVFYKEKNIERIVTYCEKDVITTAQILLKFQFKNILKPEEIETVN